MDEVGEKFMPRVGLNVEKIVGIAVEITDAKGIDAVTLKEIGKRLDVSAPALFNHIGNLAEIREKVSHRVMELLRAEMAKAAIGKSGVDKIRASGKAYIAFAMEHPYLYETTQWINVWSETEEKSVFFDFIKFMWDICAEIGMNELETNHTIRCFRSLIHGFANIESHHGFGYHTSIQDSFEYAVDIFILGIKAKYEARQCIYKKEDPAFLFSDLDVYRI